MIWYNKKIKTNTEKIDKEGRERETVERVYSGLFRSLCVTAAKLQFLLETFKVAQNNYSALRV